MSITARQYRQSHFIVGIDAEKLPDAGFTGYSTRDGSLLTMKVKAVDKSNNGIPSNQMPTHLYLTMLYNGLLVLSDTGVEVQD